jgi:hypothetical protein
VKCEEQHIELKRLVDLQRKARHDEIFGGFSKAERLEFDARATRIAEIEIEVEAEQFRMKAAAEQRREWNKTAETDTPQKEAHQSYRSREKDSSKAFTDSLKTGSIPRKETNKDDTKS